ncbi:GNAT family N-acetyltransferase [Streptomyces sp. 4.24]|uniref:GNAT family N-acetyltransferase n=1 Tax=Streptomyces tritrimontium TaxID=3406573 RepID=UPI003BB63CA2
MIITRATPSDLPRLLQYRNEASDWLADRGIDQWRNAFPPDHILESIAAGSVFMVCEGGQTTATVTLDTEPEPDLWSSAELLEPCLHLHKLIVLREFGGSGLGRRVLDWAGDRAARSGHRWVRINVNTQNRGLQRYYLDNGFEYVRTVEGGGVGGAGVAGWLAQRPACKNDAHGLVDDLTEGESDVDVA